MVINFYYFYFIYYLFLLFFLFIAAKKKNIFETSFHYDAHAHCNYFSHNKLILVFVKNIPSKLLN